MTDYLNRSAGFKERGLMEIPSEYIEPYLIAMLSMELEGIEFRPTEERLLEAKQNLKGVETFVSRFASIHARYAVMNVYEKFYRMTLEDALKICNASQKERFENC